MYRLTSVPGRNGGLVSTWGEFTSVRDCTVAARLLQQVDKRERYFNAESIDRSMQDVPILMSPGEYTSDIEIVLSDDRTVWLGDVDEVLRKHLDKTVGPLKPAKSEYRRPDYDYEGEML
jgi:hypothetical protein